MVWWTSLDSNLSGSLATLLRLYKSSQKLWIITKKWGVLWIIKSCTIEIPENHQADLRWTCYPNQPNSDSLLIRRIRLSKFLISHPLVSILFVIIVITVCMSTWNISYVGWILVVGVARSRNTCCCCSSKCRKQCPKKASSVSPAKRRKRMPKK